MAEREEKSTHRFPMKRLLALERIRKERKKKENSCIKIGWGIRIETRIREKYDCIFTLSRRIFFSLSSLFITFFL